MTRNTLNFLIDLATAAIMLGMIATGLIVRFVLPPGSGLARSLWNLNRHEWGDVHFWLAVAAGVTVLLHLALHWQWVTVMVARLSARRSANDIPSRLRRNVAGTALLIFTVGIFFAFVFIAQANVVGTARGEEGKPAGRAFRGGRDEPSAEFIQGSMTLADAAQAGGITVDTLKQRLSLPAGVSPDQRLGWLRRDYGLSMQQIRQAVSDDAVSQK